jgi:hypothetical protein
VAAVRPDGELGGRGTRRVPRRPRCRSDADWALLDTGPDVDAAGDVAILDVRLSDGSGVERSPPRDSFDVTGHRLRDADVRRGRRGARGRGHGGCCRWRPETGGPSEPARDRLRRSRGHPPPSVVESSTMPRSGSPGPRRPRSLRGLLLANTTGRRPFVSLRPDVPMEGMHRHTGNWKMATEGGGRHSPSTVVWEEEGVPVILRGHSGRG